MGKQIRIYLADGTSTGIRHAEITNWSGQALACPRARFSDLKDWNEIKRPGIYFLFGINEESGNDAVYIGESELVFDRLSTHLNSKDFWGELIAFTSKDDNLTKGHVKYLESRLIELATSANRYQITNTASPQLPALPRADRDAMEEYLVSVRSLLGVLGHRALDPYIQPSHTSTATVTAPTSIPLRESALTEFSYSNRTPVYFNLNIGEISARAERTNEGLVVLEGSEATINVQSSLSGTHRALREKLLASDILVQSNGKLKLTKNQLFNSPSQAAAVLVGYSINGRDAWRLKDGTTYSTYEQKVSADLLEQLK